MDELLRAAALGYIQVAETQRAIKVSGAVGDLLLEKELADLGAALDVSTGVYTVNRAGLAEDDARGLDEVVKTANKAAAALAARKALAAQQGVKLFDEERAKAQRRITREIKGVYKEAMLEHSAEIERIKNLQSLVDQNQDPVEYFKLLHTRGELESVYDALAQGLANAGAAAAGLMGGQLQQAGATARKVAAWQIDNMAGVEVSRFVAHDTATLALSGVTSYTGEPDAPKRDIYSLKAWENVSDKKAARATIKLAVARGLLTGEHPTKIAKRIEGIYTGGEPRSLYKRAVRIAQTETAAVMTMATNDYIRDLNVEGIKTRKRWDATLDGSTRDDHRRVDGEVVDEDKPFSNKLMRPGDGGAADRINCRCCLTPVLDGFEPDSPVRRDNVTGELMPYKTYKEWESGGNKGRQNVTPAAGIDSGAQVYSKLEERHVQNLDEIVTNKAKEQPKRVYKKYERDLVMLDAKHEGGAHYSPSNRGVYVNIANDETHKRGSYSTYFHEFGHNIDGLFREKTGAKVSAYDNCIFGRTIIKEVDDLVKNKHEAIKADVSRLIDEAMTNGRDFSTLISAGYMSKYAEPVLADKVAKGMSDEEFRNELVKNTKTYTSESYANHALAKEIKEHATTPEMLSDLSDIIGGATDLRINLGWGHSKAYWNRGDRTHEVANEAFAEFFSASMVNGESIKVLQKYLPESRKVFEKLLGVLEDE